MNCRSKGLTRWQGAIAVGAIALSSLQLPAQAGYSLLNPPSGGAARPNPSQTVARRGRWIAIDLSSQRLIAWEDNTPVYAVIISTGKSSTPTPTGTFTIQTKHRYARMQGDDYDLPDVPFTMYYDGSYAIHGAYWHNNFGTPVSHGCINVAVDHAEWLFYWASVGTTVVVQE